MKLFSTAAVIATIATAQPAFAQQGRSHGGGQQQRAMQQQQADINVTDQMVGQFVDAREEVQSVSQKWQGKMGDMSPQEQQKMNKKLVEAVRSTGLSVEDYNAISISMRQNPELQEKVMNALN